MHEYQLSARVVNFPASKYIPRNMHTVFALLCLVVVIHWLIFPYPSGLLHWHCGNLTIAPVPAKQPWWIWINTSCEFIMNDCITTTKQSTTKPCAYILGYTVNHMTKLWLSQGWCFAACCLSTSEIRPHWLEYCLYFTVLLQFGYLLPKYAFMGQNASECRSCYIAWLGFCYQ